MTLHYTAGNTSAHSSHMSQADIKDELECPTPVSTKHIENEHKTCQNVDDKITQKQHNK